MLRQGQGVLGRFGQQQVNLAQTEQLVTQGQAQLQLQGNARVGHFDLQLMTQCAQQLATADRIGQVVFAAVFSVEQHQGAAVVQGVQLALVQRGGLVEAVAITLEQLLKASTGQAAQLILGTQLHGQHRAVLRHVGSRRFNHGLGRAGHCFVTQVGKRVFVVIIFDSADNLPRRRLQAGHRLGFVETWVTQVAHFERRLVFVLCLFVLRLRVRLRFNRLRGEVGVQLTRQVADLVLTLGGRGVFVDVAQPHA